MKELMKTLLQTAYKKSPEYDVHHLPNMLPFARHEARFLLVVLGTIGILLRFQMILQQGDEPP